VVLHRVILGHSPPLLDAEHPLHVQARIGETICGFRLGRWDAEASVEAGQECFEDSISLLKAAGAGQAQFCHQSVLKGPVGSLHPPFRLGAVGKDLSHT
jgi:hypothetical protein